MQRALVLRSALAGLAAVALMTGCDRDTTDASAGRGAPDPLRPELIVGSEGKGYYTGAGIPPDNEPIYAARAIAQEVEIRILRIFKILFQCKRQFT
jgi:hypothetical protein